MLLWGSNARETHPIFFHHLLKGVNRGARLITVDPRRTSSAQWADLWLGLDVGSDIALANAMGREIIAAGLHAREFIERATSGFEAYRAKVEPYTLEYAERESGVPADAIREAAHAYARADRAMICWTLGITEHHNAVDNVLALISLALLTGHVGKYGSGINPLRTEPSLRYDRNVCRANPACRGDLRRVVLPCYRPITLFVVPEVDLPHAAGDQFELAFVPNPFPSVEEITHRSLD